MMISPFIQVRRLVRRAAMAVALAAALAQSPGVLAQDAYPSRPVHIVVPVSAGGATDVTARLLAQQMSKRLGAPFVVENRVGAAGTIGMAQVARANSDGYTLAWTGNGAITIAPFLYKTAGYQPLESFAPVGYATTAGWVLYASPALRVSTVPQLVALGKAQPGKLTFASAGNNGQQLAAGGGVDRHGHRAQLAQADEDGEVLGRVAQQQADMLPLLDADAAQRLRRAIGQIVQLRIGPGAPGPQLGQEHLIAATPPLRGEHLRIGQLAQAEGLVREGAHGMKVPPFTSSTAPVMYDEPSEARKDTTDAISSGSP